MDAYIIKLQFTTPVRFGSGTGLDNANYTCGCDTFFSALCIETIKRSGLSGLEKLLDKTRNGQFCLSNFMPFYAEELYLPKPLLWIDTPVKAAVQENTVKRKAMKALKWIGATQINHYIQAIQNGDYFSGNNKAVAKSFVQYRNAKSYREETLPYAVTAYRFNADCGLYAIIQTEADYFEEIYDIILDLGLTGIGGKVSSGFGKYTEYEEPIQLFDDGSGLYESDMVISQMLFSEASRYMLISDTIPTEKDIEGIDSESDTYALAAKNGFVQSPNYGATPQKRKQIHTISAGSSFNHKMQGSMIDVKKEGNHPVYRYGLAMQLGVEV